MFDFFKRFNLSFIFRMVLIYLIISVGGIISDKTKTIDDINNIVYVNYVLGFLVGYLVFKITCDYYRD